jgi:hypothetical protein
VGSRRCARLVDDEAVARLRVMNDAAVELPRRYLDEPAGKLSGAGEPT